MSALVIVDIQNDFLPNGALAVESGDKIIPKINELMKEPFDIIVATKDWHPKEHASFAVNQGRLVGEVIQLGEITQILWPVHCVQGTKGAEFASELDTSKFEKVFYKGVDPSIDSYSGFYDNGHKQATGLGDYLKQNNITDVYLAGLTTDYCVKYSALDAINLGFNVYVILDCCRGVDVHADDCLHAIEEMKEAGVHLIRTPIHLRDEPQS